jgi:hypothetical protein
MCWRSSSWNGKTVGNSLMHSTLTCLKTFFNNGGSYSTKGTLHGKWGVETTYMTCPISYVLLHSDNLTGCKDTNMNKCGSITSHVNTYFLIQKSHLCGYSSNILCLYMNYIQATALLIDHSKITIVIMLCYVLKVSGLSAIQKGLLVQYILFWVGKPKGKDHLVWLGIDGMKVIKMISKQAREWYRLKVFEDIAEDNIWTKKCCARRVKKIL